MIPKTSTLVYPPAARRPRNWQNHLKSLFTLLAVLTVALKGFAQAPPTFIGDQLTIQAVTTTTSGTTTYRGPSTTATDTTVVPSFRNADLGMGNKFDISNGSLQITVVSDTLSPYYVTYKNGIPSLATGSYNSSSFYYRVYLAGTVAPAYTPIQLVLTSSKNSSVPTTYAAANIDLFAVPRNTGGGTYQVDIYFDASFQSSTGSKLGTDPGNGAGNPLKATFTVQAPAVTPVGATTTWQGFARGSSNGTVAILPSDTEWTNVANWSNGVPTATSNAIIPPKANSAIVYPVLNDPSYNYSVNNLTIQGNSSSSRGELTINAATLTVYGDLLQTAGGLSGNTVGTPGQTDATKNSTIVFAGNNQLITGNLVVSDVIIAGSGIKSVINQLIPSNILAFEPTSAANGVIVQSAAQDNTNGTVNTVFDTTGNSYIQLGAAAQVSIVPGQAETLTSYVKGVLRADRTLTANSFDSFGNIGLDITPNHTPGRIYVYRVVGDALTGPISRTAVPIKRQYKIVGDDDSNSSGTADSKVNVVFHYLPSTDELNGIDENNLTMFLTQTNGAPYTAAFGTLYAGQRIVVRNDLPSLTSYTLTLGDKTNPLPVSLVAFGAVRNGADAVMNWTTASEERNTGFNVQVSTDGANFRTLSFVASQSPNSSTTLKYKYTDTESGKVGTRYYRLEQVDEDGKKNYSPVRILNFSGAAAGTGALVAYPNPFNEEVSLSLDGGSVADGTALVKIVDMTGRTVHESKLSLVGSSLTLSDMGTLRSGLYLAKVTLPDGTTQTVRISKQ